MITSGRSPLNVLRLSGIISLLLPPKSQLRVSAVRQFVQSLHGISHNKIEDTKEEHLELCVTAFDNRELAGETYGQLQPGKLYLFCLGKKSGASNRDRLILGDGLLPITKAGWSSDWDKLPPKEQITEVLATRMAQLRSNLEKPVVERERLKQILEQERSRTQ